MLGWQRPYTELHIRKKKIELTMVPGGQGVNLHVVVLESGGRRAGWPAWCPGGRLAMEVEEAVDDDVLQRVKMKWTKVFMDASTRATASARRFSLWSMTSVGQPSSPSSPPRRRRAGRRRRQGHLVLVVDPSEN